MGKQVKELRLQKIYLKIWIKIYQIVMFLNIKQNQNELIYTLYKMLRSYWIHSTPYNYLDILLHSLSTSSSSSQLFLLTYAKPTW